MTRLELSVIVVGFVAMVVAIGAVDWRLGLFTLGSGLVASTLDLRRRS